MPRLSLRVRGVVQGVGFRPFVFRIAHRLGLAGWVRNRPDGVEIQVQGAPEALSAFRRALEAERPAPARIQDIHSESRPELPEASTFEILPSAASEETRPSVPADLALCEECARELRTPSDRRHRYPFINCTHCGPRYSIIESLPYDRPRTSMKGFPLCDDCRREYEDPLDRRFHAEPVACPRCGPQVRLFSQGRESTIAGAALREAAAAMLRGEVLALKGLGGFQLLVDATSEEAVQKLRQRKRREEKPFAVMFPDMESLRGACEVGEGEAEWLTSPEAPILLLRRRLGAGIAGSVAPGNPRIGAFLPYTPLHRLLLEEVGRPLVCTSGNLSEEPMAIEEADAFERLGDIADHFLVHDRPILRPVDDSVLRLDEQGTMMLRRARGFAPLAHSMAFAGQPILALGAHQKSTVTLLKSGQAIVSQHLGDLHNIQGVRLLERTVEDVLDFFRARPARLACDLHPDYASTRLAERLSGQWNIPLSRVQHHHAHVAAVMAEHGLKGPVLGLAWDGSGYGPDGTVWGGEALVVDGRGFKRVGHLREFPLPGGEKAVKEPGRSAAGLLWTTQGPDALQRLSACFTPSETLLLRSILERGLNTPRTSSLGRLFDAVSALIGIRTGCGFEGQAAMELEFAAQRSQDAGSYLWNFTEELPWVADPAALVSSMLEDFEGGVAPEALARRFHNALADLALLWAQRAELPQVVLCGGCFQNALLAGLVHRRLSGAGFQTILPSAFPPNDGAISLGQAWVVTQTESRG